MTERGLVIAGEVLPGTDWCLRDPAHWWATGDRGSRLRARTIDLLVGHWTAGEAGTDRYDDDGPRVVRAMRARKRPDGSLMEVGVHFVIGAGPEDEALVWQTADPGLTATVHVSRAWNRRSIGVELVSAGLPGLLDVRARHRVIVPLLGRQREILALYPGQLRAWVRLAETLASLHGCGGIAIPRCVPPEGALRRLSAREARSVSGAVEHLHSPTTSKIDAGGLLVAELARVGWSPGVLAS